MTPVKGEDASPFPKRFALLLRLLSPWREKALSYAELAEKMGEGFTEEAVKSWAKRKEFAATARERLVELAEEEGITGLTIAWLRDGKGRDPVKRQGEMKRLAKLQQRGGESTGDGDENGTPSFLDYTLRTTRHLAAAEQEGATPAVQLRILKLAEEIGVEQFGQRAKAFIERERQRIQRGEKLGADGSP